jgi:hypothetical protein
MGLLAVSTSARLPQVPGSRIGYDGNALEPATPMLSVAVPITETLDHRRLLS